MLGNSPLQPSIQLPSLDSLMKKNINMKNLFAVKNQNRIFFQLTRAESSSELFWLPVVHLSVSKLYTFSSSPPEPLGQIQPVSLGEGDSSCSNKGPHPYPKGYDNKIPVVIIH